MLLLSWLACSGAPADTGWTPPTFTGDGLPASEDTAHDTLRGDTGGGGDTGGDTGSALPTLLITDALFAWYQLYGTYWVGFLVLLTEENDCGSIFGDGLYPDGIYFYLYPPVDSGGEPEWAGTYPACGSEPCNQAFWVASSSFGYLDGTVDFESVDDHYVTATWSTDGFGEGGPLTFYNCGDGSVWSN